MSVTAVPGGGGGGKETEGPTGLVGRPVQQN